MKSKTLFDKVWDNHVVSEVPNGPQILYIDQHLIHEVTSPQAFAELIPRIPSSLVRVAESGISTRADVDFAQKHGANAILVGEALVRAGDPIAAMRELLGLGRLES